MFRIFVERKPGFTNEADHIRNEITNFLGVNTVSAVRYVNRYDIENISDPVCEAAVSRVFAELQSDTYYFSLSTAPEDTVIAWEYLPGQYDQRADSAEQCLALLSASFGSPDAGFPARVRCARLVILSGCISAADIQKITAYLVNPVDSRTASLDMPDTLAMHSAYPPDVVVQNGFIDFDETLLDGYRKQAGLAMDIQDLLFLQAYFKREGRDPTETEIKVLDTYWSDHCRHTTFNTVLDRIDIEDGPYADVFGRSLELYTAMRTELYAGKDKPVTLMDIAVIGAKYLKEHGMLEDIEISDEINACSMYIDVHYTDKDEVEKWLLMFKNETHNHPTEIEPFGGAATCIGGAIRDPLSGRAWVYQALRVTGAADPTVPVSQTRPGKLPQIKLTREAAAGFSSYGNQIGLATGQVAEIYHPGFEAKRMELGAVIAAVPADRVVRGEPEPGDAVILIGGGTGRDGIGGATGSSKVHTEKSVSDAAAEVQKGNAVEERKIQRLFRNPRAARLIRRCNDFGAGGVAVAVGELAPGLEIDLDAVPKKYEGLNGTEIAVSESQERMAVVVRAEDVSFLQAAAAAENLSSAVVARVTDSGRLVMKWRKKVIADIERSFLDAAGAKKRASAAIVSPDPAASPLLKILASVSGALSAGGAEKAWLACISDLACCSQRGLSERFDGSIGAASVLFPMGGAYQSTPEIAMAAKIPAEDRETDTVSLMSFGYDPRVAEWSPWHGAQIAVLVSLARIAAAGGDPARCRLTFQEYFERLVSPDSWGKPAAALLGALAAQKAAGTAAVGGKDSMSGSFEDLHVPPSLVSFAVCTETAGMVRGGSFTAEDMPLWIISVPYSEKQEPDFEAFMQNGKALHRLSETGRIRAAYTTGAGGIAEAAAKMAFGNRIGAVIEHMPSASLLPGSPAGDAALFVPRYGAIIIETEEDLSAEAGFVSGTVCRLGRTDASGRIRVEAEGLSPVSISVETLYESWEKTLSAVFPVVSDPPACAAPRALPGFAARTHPSLNKKKISVAVKGRAKPRVLLPVFPGTNCEYDMKRAFALAGGEPRIFVFRNNSIGALTESLAAFKKELGQCQILALSGGFSAGDEPDGSGKYIANVLREQGIRAAVSDLLENRDGLILGICNGFQALIKTGLVPYGTICDPDETMPTLTYNTIGRHVSRLVRTRMVSSLSPWSWHESMQNNGFHTVPVSHGEGRLVIENGCAEKLFAAGQIFSQYVDMSGCPSCTEPHNPNGSAFAVEGMTSADGRVLGKMGHSERAVSAAASGGPSGLFKNRGRMDAEKFSLCQNIFAAGVLYFS